MAVRLVDTAWGKEFTDALRVDASQLNIICPFIKVGSLGRLLSEHPKSIQVITRFNLGDFAEGVSDIAALRILLEAGARVRGVRNLHAKLYLFGRSRAIVTSANLTEAGINRNHEFGMVADEQIVIASCRSYFDALWKRSGADLTNDRLQAWDESVTRHHASGGRSSRKTGLSDFGVDAGFHESPSVSLPAVVTDASQAFVKFLGEGNNRVPLSFTTIEEIERAGCHWAVAYPASRRPRGVKDDAVIFIGRITEDPNDIRIFGRATGMRHEPGRDDATPEDIARRPWKATWPRYIRVHNAEFVAGTMANGISLNDLMDALGANSFLPTQRNTSLGHGNTNPRKAYRQQAAVELSRQGWLWLAERLQSAFDAHGLVPRDTLDALDWPVLSNAPLKKRSKKR